MRKIDKHSLGRNPFTQFALTYLLVIVITLCTMLPLYAQLRRSAEQSALQDLHAHTLTQLDLLQQDTVEELFSIARNLYEEPELNRFYHQSDLNSASLLYELSSLRSRLNLYFSYLSDVEDVALYLPKFGQVVNFKYILSSPKQFYLYYNYQGFEENWLDKALSGDFFVTMRSCLVSSTADYMIDEPRMNLIYSFPMVGADSRPMVIVISLNAGTLAKRFLPSDISNESFAVLCDTSDRILAAAGNADLVLGEALEIEQLKQADIRLLEYPYSYGTLYLGVPNSYITRATLNVTHFVLMDILCALVISTMVSLLLSYYRSRPVARMLEALDRAGQQPSGDVYTAIEGSLNGMIQQTEHYRNQLDKLDATLRDGLCRRLFTVGLQDSEDIHAFEHCFGALPSRYRIAAVGPADTSPKSLLAALSEVNLTAVVLYQPTEADVSFLLLPDGDTLADQLELALVALVEQEFVAYAGLSDGIEGFAALPRAARQAQARWHGAKSAPNGYLMTQGDGQEAFNKRDLDALYQSLISGSESQTDRCTHLLLQSANAASRIELRQLEQALCNVYEATCAELTQRAGGLLPVKLPVFIGAGDPPSADLLQEATKQQNQAILSTVEQLQRRNVTRWGIAILEYIDQNVSNPDLSPRLIAEQFNLSEKYIYKLVKDACGESPNQRITRLRVQKAIVCLRDEGLPVNKTAELCGFGSSNSMYKAFQRVTGLPPSTYCAPQYGQAPASTPSDPSDTKEG